VQDIERNGGGRSVANDHYLDLNRRWIQVGSVVLDRDQHFATMASEVFARREYGPAHLAADRRFREAESADPKGAAALRAMMRNSQLWHLHQP
jgi:hypothetical protein